LKDNITDFFMTPDAQIGWLPYAVRAGKKAIRKHQVNVIYSTGSPWTDHLIGCRLKYASGLPWIADFRDPWMQNPWHTWKLPRRLKRESQMEAEVVHEADIVIANTERLRLDFIKRYPEEPGAKFITITNGYDLDSLAPLNVKRSQNQAMTITHTGTLYAERSPRNLLLAIQELLHENIIPVCGIRLRLVGQGKTNDIKDILADKLVSHVVEIIPQVPHRQSLQYLSEADVLLIIQPQAPMQIPGKLFEYMCFQRPILAITEAESATSDIIRQAQLGLIVEPEDISGIKKAVCNLYEQFQSGTLLSLHGDTNTIRQYDARILTLQFAEILDHLINHQAEDTQK
jgi:glycosyltransferase involved in cell wall biosynthesis